jgi:hypothetical protein
MALAPGDSGTWRLVIGEAGTCGFATLVVGGLSGSVAQAPWWWGESGQSNRFGGRWIWWITGSWRMVAYPPLVPVA